MEGVLQALKRMHAKTGADHAGEPTSNPEGAVSPTGHDTEILRRIAVGSTLKLDRSTLMANRIVSFDSGCDQTRPYDVLRNLVLDDLAEVGSRTIAVTSPTKGCGVTVTATNLAFSIARLRKAKVLLFDCKPGGPGIPEAFGRSRLLVSPSGGDWDPHISAVDVDGVELYVGSAALVHQSGGREGFDQENSVSLAQLKQQLGPLTVVLDLPPILTGDQTLPLILGADMVLLVLAVGHSTVADLEACKTYLNESGRVQVVLNKSRKHGL